MNAMQVLRNSIEGSYQWARRLATDLSDQPMAAVQPGWNHVLWLVGHLAGSEAAMFEGFILGKPPEKPQWRELFGPGSQPKPDAAAYPSLDELFTYWEQVHNRAMEALGHMSEEDLDAPSTAPAPLKEKFGTVGACLTMIGLHNMTHAGQLADIRKQLGRKPLLVM